MVLKTILEKSCLNKDVIVTLCGVGRWPGVFVETSHDKSIHVIVLVYATIKSTWVVLEHAENYFPSRHSDNDNYE